jgi:hypothetical protein
MMKTQFLRSIRIWLSVVILGLILSGVTAFPLQHETAICSSASLRTTQPPTACTGAQRLARPRQRRTYRHRHSATPFLAYGTDWLAFAHLVIAVAFVGPWRDPFRNQWIITWGLIACASVPLLALIAGPIRGIPLYWRFIDCSFGLICCLPLLAIRRLIAQLEALAPYPRPS